MSNKVTDDNIPPEPTVHKITENEALELTTQEHVLNHHLKRVRKCKKENIQWMYTASYYRVYSCKVGQKCKNKACAFYHTPNERRFRRPQRTDTSGSPNVSLFLFF